MSIAVNPFIESLSSWTRSDQHPASQHVPLLVVEQTRFTEDKKLTADLSHTVQPASSNGESLFGIIHNDTSTTYLRKHKVSKPAYTILQSSQYSLLIGR